MDGWDLLVDRSDLTRTTLKPMDPSAALAEGEAMLEVESFALTANNITYGAVGDQIGYWRFFPAPEGQGRIPVWGFARVIRSRNPETPEGLRLFGYWPMSSHTIGRFAKRPTGYVEVSEHRADLPPTYNSYQAAEPTEADDWRSLLQPLVMTSFLIDDQLSDADLKSLVLSSASSKTAMGLAWFARRRGVRVIGLTSAGHVDALKGYGLYDEVLSYEDIATVKAPGPAAYVDFAGRSAVTHAVHAALGEVLTISLVVGVTHWEAIGGPPPPTGPAPAFFFAPDRVRQRIADWGGEELQRRAFEGLRGFVAGNPWLKLRQHVGADALRAIYADVVAGRMKPDEGHIVRPR